MAMNIPDNLGTPTNNISIPDNLGTPIQQPSNDNTGALGAFGAGIYHIYDQLGTWGAKNAAAFINPLLGVGPTSKEVQQTFDSDTAQYNQKVKNHPVASELGEVLGPLPLMALGGGEGLLAKVGINALQGGILGGVLGATNPGSGGQLFNTTGAVQGGVMGGLLGGVSQGVSNYLGNTSALSAAQKSIADIGGKTKLIGSDFTSPIYKTIINNTVGQLPSFLGMKPYRDAQFQQFVPDIMNYLDKTGAGDSTKTLASLQTILKNKASSMEQTEAQAWNQLPQVAKDNNVSNVNMESLAPLKQQILTNPATNKTIVNKLSNLSPNMDISDAINLKRDIYPDYKFLANKIAKGTATSDEKDLANNLQNMYWNTVDNIKNTVQGTPAENTFEQANALTIGNKTLFDPKTNKYLTNAIDSTKGYLDDMRTFAKSMLSGSSPQRQQANLGMLGSEGDKLLGGYGLGQILNKNLDLTNISRDSNGRLIPSTASLNIQGFLNDLGQSQIKSDVMTPTVQALSGLTKAMQQYSNSVGSAQSGGLASQIAGQVNHSVANTALAGGVGLAAMHNPGLGASVAATAPVLSAISRYAPIKNSLIGLNTILEKSTGNPELATYFLQQLNKQLPKAGIILSHDKLGNPVLDKQETQ